MEIPKTFEPEEIEKKWYAYWQEKGFFRSVPDSREPYVVVMPPPNVTGVLHMGHMLNNTIQDVLVRKARMEGKNACWVPGTDHASIATEAKVVALLKEKGISKSDLSREEFLQHAWEWKEKYGGIILEQLKKLGASCDWERTRFTMEKDLSDAVIGVFVDLYKKGHIYRGVRMVNWDPAGLTAVSDEEVIHKEVNSKLFHIRYPFVDGSGSITIATTRPETILGDTAICVHPDDQRYASLKGKKVLVPLINREIPVIFDDYVNMEFGTGALKVTPAHDINDYMLGIKHKIPSIDILNPDGTLSEKAGLYIGEDRFTVRKKIAIELEEKGFLVKVEEIKNKVGFSERTNAVIEPRLSLQWFLKMEELAKPALENVLNNNIRLHPDKFKNTYRSWMENVHDWCISRQLWWGQRIPAFYLPNGDVIVENTLEQALSEARKKDPGLSEADLRQDEDVLDTWFSSWLWPISVFDGFKDPDNKDIQYYYPSNDLVTAPEILFFWVARMIIAGYEYRGDKPFSNVYLTGIVRDKQGRKMSKSLGNSPDPLDLIAKYGADGVRVGMLFSSPAGNDLLFDEGLCEQGRNFSNKIWNAFRLVKGWEINEDQLSKDQKVAVDWMNNRLSQETEIIQDHFKKFRISDALMSIYKLIWDDFCSWYLEMIKPPYQHPLGSAALEETTQIFEKLLALLHPFMPFISEEIWHLLRFRKEEECLIVASWPKPEISDSGILKDFETASQIITSIRNYRKEKNIPVREELVLVRAAADPLYPLSFEGHIKKLCGVTSIEIAQKPEPCYTFLTGTLEFYIPLSGNVDLEAESEKIIKEIDYLRGFLKSVVSKLSNEKFVSNARPEIVENERNKQADAEKKIRLLEEQLQQIKSSL